MRRTSPTKHVKFVQSDTQTARKTSPGLVMSTCIKLFSFLAKIEFIFQWKNEYSNILVAHKDNVCLA